MPSSSPRSFSRRLTILGSIAAVGSALLFAGVWRLAVADDPIKPPVPAPGMDDPAMADPGMMGDPAMADPAVPPPPKVEPVPKAKAWEELHLLEGLLKNKKADNGDILASLDTVCSAYHNFAADDEAGKATLEDDKAKFQKEAEAAFLLAYKLKRINAKAKANERDDVNIKAVQLLGTFRPDVSSDIFGILQDVIFKVKDDEYKVPQTLIDESFKAIGTLADKKKGIPWLMTWVKYPSGPGEPEKVKAAYDALILVKLSELKAPEKVTFVKDTIKFFVGPEAAAKQNQDKNQRAAKETWDKIKNSVIKALQYFSLEPKDAKGAQFSTVAQFNEWFKDHGTVRDPNFADPKK